MSGNRGRTVPDGYTTVTPWIISRSTAELIDYVIAAFGAEELGRFTDDNGVVGHAEFRVGDAIVLAFDAASHWPDTPAFLRLYVDDCDAVFRRAVEAGGEPFTEPTTAPFGERVARVRDPLGNLWWIHTRVEEVSEEEFARRMGEPEWTAAMRYLQSKDFVSATDR